MHLLDLQIDEKQIHQLEQAIEQAVEYVIIHNGNKAFVYADAEVENFFRVQYNTAKNEATIVCRYSFDGYDHAGNGKYSSWVNPFLNERLNVPFIIENAYRNVRSCQLKNMIPVQKVIDISRGKEVTRSYYVLSDVVNIEEFLDEKVYEGYDVFGRGRGKITTDDEVKKIIAGLEFMGRKGHMIVKLIGEK